LLMAIAISFKAFPCAAADRLRNGADAHISGEEATKQTFALGFLLTQ
jgi:hypothetical protein